MIRWVGRHLDSFIPESVHLKGEFSASRTFVLLVISSFCVLFSLTLVEIHNGATWWAFAIRLFNLILILVSLAVLN